MPRKSNQSSQWDFAVATTRMHYPDGTPSNLFATYRPDNKYAFGEVSEKGYGLLQNRDFITTVREALTGLGLTDYKESIIVTDSGAKLFATYEFDNRIRTINKVGDKVGLKLRFADSKDGTIAARGELLAKILRCLNGAMTEEGEFSLYQRHNTNISLDFVKDVVGKAVNDFDRALAVFDRLTEVNISDEQGVNILKRAKLSDKVLEQIQKIWITPNFAESRARTLYALYDAATEYLRDVETARFLHANTLNRQILRHIVRGLDPLVLAGLIAPVPQPTVTEITSAVITVEEVPATTPPGEPPTFIGPPQ